MLYKAAEIKRVDETPSVSMGSWLGAGTKEVEAVRMKMRTFDVGVALLSPHLHLLWQTNGMSSWTLNT